MMERVRTPGSKFYSNTAVRTWTRQDVLDGQVIKINPALVTITDGLINQVASAELQQQVVEQVRQLLAHKIQTFHVDVNFEDYSGFGTSRPDSNMTVFTPQFLQALNHLVQAKGAFLNLHLLTDFPLLHLTEYAIVGAGAICFQLDSISDRKVLAQLVERIQYLGACASPVVETVGSENRKPRSKEEVLALLEPILSQVGMLTFQMAGTASRSNKLTGQLAIDQARSYISPMKRVFNGTIQLQGGITTQTIGDAVRLGAQFVVCGSEIFRDREGRPAWVVIDQLLQGAVDVLGEQAEA